MEADHSSPALVPCMGTSNEGMGEAVAVPPGLCQVESQGWGRATKPHPRAGREKCFKVLHLLNLLKRRQRGDLITMSKYLHREKIPDTKGLFKPSEKGRMGTNGSKAETNQS